MSFIKECLKGNGTIRSIIVALIVAIVIVPVVCEGLYKEFQTNVKSYNEAAKLLQKGE
jgi:hypothetical protein